MGNFVKRQSRPEINMAEQYPTRSILDQSTASQDQSGPMEDQYGLVVDQSQPLMEGQHGKVVDHSDPDPVEMIMADQDSALQYVQRTGAATANFTETQYNVSGGQTIQNIYYPEQAKPSTSDMSKETFDLHECQEDLRACYLKEMDRVHMLPWVPEESKEMESIFVDQELVRKGESKASQTIKSNEDLVTLQTSHGQSVNRILITGDAGSGKSTTVNNLAYKWALNDPQSSLSKFSLVFLIGMKDIEDSNSSLVDLIFENILTEDSNVSKDGLNMFIKENAKDILFLIDGMDEDSSGALQNKSSGITKLVRNKKLPKSCVILTSRNISNLGMYACHYTQVKLEGFSVKNIHKYIVKFFRDDQEKVDLLFRKLEAEPHILALASIPVLLLMICMLWEDQRTTPKTKTQLYQETLRYLWRRYKAKMGGGLPLDEESDIDEFDEELKDLLNKMGELALNSAHLDWYKSIFTVTEFGTEVCDLGCRVGILRRERSRTGLKRKTLATFLHSTFQHFCAAFHLAYLLDSKKAKLDDFDGILFSFSKDEFIFHRYVLEFCCGIYPEVTTTFLQLHTERAVQIVSEIKEPFNVDISFPMRLIFEGQLSYEECSNLTPLFSSLYGTVLVLNDDLIPSILYILELYKSSAPQTGFFSTINSLQVQTGYTSWLPALLKHTNNLHRFVVHLGVSGIVGDLDKMYKALSELSNIKELSLLILNTHAPVFHTYDATNLLTFLAEKRVKLTQFELVGCQFNAKLMVRYLASTRTSILRLALGGAIDAQGQFAIDNVIEILPSLELKHLNHLELGKFQGHSAIKHLRPIISQLEALALNSCNLHEKHLKELFSFPSRAQKLKLLDLSMNMFSVTLVKVLVECLREIPFLENLRLEETGLNDESACILARFVREKPSINALFLEHNPGIGHAGEDALRGLPLKRRIFGPIGVVYEDID